MLARCVCSSTSLGTERSTSYVAEPEDRIIPIIEEVATLSTREVETARLRVRTIVEEKTTDVVAQLAKQELLVERRTVEREVAEAPRPYEDGDLLIVPIVEERLVVEKRLFVIEELVVRCVARTEEVHVPATVRTMRAIVERDGDQT